MPPAMANLIAIKRIAEMATARGISRIDAGPHGIAMETDRQLCHKGWQRAGDRYFVPQRTGKDERIAAVSRLIEMVD